MFKIVQLDKSLPLPKYATNGSAGMDLYASLPEDKVFVLGPFEGRAVINTGIAIQIPIGYEAQIRPRSGNALNYGVTVLNTPGTIDPDYRGEVGVILINHGFSDFVIKHGDRIAQMVIAPIKRIDWKVVEELDPTTRGEGGFGHTGV